MTEPFFIDENKNHAACGIGITVDLGKEQRVDKKVELIAPSRNIVRNAISKLEGLEYRSGYNITTQESDGAGFRFYGLPHKFFQKNVPDKVKLEEGKFAVGQYFIDHANINSAQEYIEEKLKKNDLKVVGWRNVAQKVDKSRISDNAKAKMPAMWQAIIVNANQDKKLSLEQKTLNAAADIVQNKGELIFDIVSQSSESVVYKGMIEPKEVGNFYKDLQDPDFTAKAVQMHSRFATNTSPQWNNAQPTCFYIAHNGEFNSQLSNARQMAATKHVKDVDANPNLSDSIQFDTDVANFIRRGWSIEEALTMFMPLVLPDGSSDEIKNMIQYFGLKRNGYNGPAYIVAGQNGNFIAKLDPSALRPARYIITKDPKTGKRQFHAYSDDDFTEAQIPWKHRIKSGNLGAGEMIMVTKDGEVLENRAILDKVHKQALARMRQETGDASLTFEKLIDSLVTNLEAIKTKSEQERQHNNEDENENESKAQQSEVVAKGSELTLLQKLEASFWDYESVKDIVEPMALHGKERVGAMGNDTSLIPALAYTKGIPLHISYFFHQLHAQVSSPPIDPIKERGSFSLEVTLGKKPLSKDDLAKKKPVNITVESPILHKGDLEAIENNRSGIAVHRIDTVFKPEASGNARTYLVRSDGLMRKAKACSRRVKNENLSEAESKKFEMLAKQYQTEAKQLRAKAETDRAQAEADMETALKQLVKAAEKAAKEGGIIVLTDRALGKGKAVIPDVIAVAAVKKHLEAKNLSNNVSIVADSKQIVGPQQAAVLLSFGAEAVYASGAYEKIDQMVKSHPSFSQKDLQPHENYQHAMDKSLLKIMGKMGITDVNNYINGGLLSSLGLNFKDKKDQDSAISDSPNLTNIFGGTYSPIGGFGLGHIADAVINRHKQAMKEKYRKTLPRFGHFKPEDKGIKHGFGHEVVNAFTQWLNEEHKRDIKYEIAQKLQEKFKKDDLNSNQKRPAWIDTASPKLSNGKVNPNYQLFDLSRGCINGIKKDENGIYDPKDLEGFKNSKAYKAYSKRVQAYRRDNPTTIYDLYTLADASAERPETRKANLQTQADIRKRFYSGSMSQGSLTVADPDKMEDLKAHGTITRAANAVGVNSSSGEGGENDHQVAEFGKTSRSKQIASGRFGISAKQLRNAREIEIKIAQGAKPGEGGQLPGYKVTIRIASQRGSIPGVELISPPPHHDIYSIEDLAQLIYDLKSVAPKTAVAVKLVASKGIGTIATGVAKAGADIINVASNSGGTGAALQTSIKHAGLPSEVGVRLVYKALAESGYDKVRIKTSQQFKTGYDVIKAAMFGATDFEFGTIAMMTVGCKMQRTCNKSCEPGVAKNGEKFQGKMIDTERYFLNVAAEAQAILQKLGFKSLDEIRGRTDLLQLVDKEACKDMGLDFSRLMAKPNTLKLDQNDEKRIAKTKKEKSKRRDDKLIEDIKAGLKASDSVESEIITPLSGQDRSFGVRIAGEFYKELEENDKTITISTHGSVGQSYGFVNPHGITLRHTGSVQDGAAKSMSGGELIVITPKGNENYKVHENTIAGNAIGYGASGGKIFINGMVGHRAGILLKGAQMVCEGTGKYAFEYMTSGTAMVLGKTGKDVGVGSSGGVIFVYDDNKDDKKVASRMSDDVILVNANSSKAYEKAIKKMLFEHSEKTQSKRANEILQEMYLGINNFKIYIPRHIATPVKDKPEARINTIAGITDVVKTYIYRKAPISIGMKVWLNAKILEIIDYNKTHLESCENLQELEKDLKDLKKSVQDSMQDTVEDKEIFTDEGAKSIQDAIKVLIEAANLKLQSQKVIQEKENNNVTKIVDIEDLLGRNVRKPKHRIKSINGLTDDQRKEFNNLLSTMKGIALVGAINDAKNGGSDCSSCRSQSCEETEPRPSNTFQNLVSNGCPEHKPIGSINGVLKQIGDLSNIASLNQITVGQWILLRQAFELQIEKTPFIAFTGAACPAPCESACTEGISKDGKPVPIKDTEFALYRIGKAMGWFEDPNTPSFDDTQTALKKTLGNQYQAYQRQMWPYQQKQAFSCHPNLSKKEQDNNNKNNAANDNSPKKESQQRVVIVGSGSAAMEVAYKALRDGIAVSMYEKSDKPGGLLMDGIPAHKYDKKIVSWHFEQLKQMGLDLHLNSKVEYDQDRNCFKVEDKTENDVEKIGQVIASNSDPNTFIVMAVGAGAPRKLTEDKNITIAKNVDKKRFVQAVDFLKAANDITAELIKKKLNQSNPDHKEQIDSIIKEHFGDIMDPRGKDIVVVGGGDTAQDANRYLIRYFNSFKKEHDAKSLRILVRGSEKNDARGVDDRYPSQAKNKSKENKLQEEEIALMHNVKVDYLTSVTTINKGKDAGLNITMKHEELLYKKEIDALGLEEIYNALPRSDKPTKELNTEEIEADIIIQALGFRGVLDIQKAPKHGEKLSGFEMLMSSVTPESENIFVVGDTSIHNRIIVEAQSNAADTYDNKIRPLLDIKERVRESKQELSMAI